MSRVYCLLENVNEFLQLRDSIIRRSSGLCTALHAMQLLWIPGEGADDSCKFVRRIWISGDGKPELRAESGGVGLLGRKRHDRLSGSKDSIHFTGYDDAL